MARRLFDSDMPAESIEHYLTLAALCPTPEKAAEKVLAPIEAFITEFRRKGAPRNRDTLDRMREAMDGMRQVGLRVNS